MFASSFTCQGERAHHQSFILKATWWSSLIIPPISSTALFVRMRERELRVRECVRVSAFLSLLVCAYVLCLISASWFLNAAKIIHAFT
jgi:hypothetical protein